MAIFRQVHTQFWSDPKVLDDMTPEDRYFMLYLMTNPHTNACGCYEISKRQIEAVATSMGMISKKTAIAKHPWVDDVDQELEQLEADDQIKFDRMPMTGDEDDDSEDGDEADSSDSGGDAA